MARNGYISLHRSLLDHWIWPSGQAYTPAEAWLWLLMNASHTAHKKRSDGQMIEVGVGELLTSINDLSKVFGWGWRRTEGFFKDLEDDGMIRREKRTRYDISVKINNYAALQGKNEGSRRDDDRANDEVTFWNPPQRETKKASIIRENNGNNNSPTETSSSSQEKKLFSDRGIPANATDIQEGNEKKRLWDTGLALLLRAGEKERSARMFLGKLVKTYGLVNVLDALNVTEQENAIDPKAFLIGVLKAQPMKSSPKTGSYQPKQGALNAHKPWLPPPDCGCSMCHAIVKAASSSNFMQGRI